MKNKHTIGQLQDGVRSILAKSGYALPDEDKAILEAILVELDEMSTNSTDESSYDVLKVLSLLLRFLKFFGIEDISELF